jgi:O-acetyl-ADP-ribose deacetylase (regulator of RNase III)
MPGKFIGLDLDDYRELVRLDEPFERPVAGPGRNEVDESSITPVLDYLVNAFKGKGYGIWFDKIPDGYRAKRELFYVLLTVRDPEKNPLPDAIHEKIDFILHRENHGRTLVDPIKLPTISEKFPRTPYRCKDNCTLWQGDIRTIRADGIVNAANKNLLGCFKPFHKCIDNVIHAAAGPRVRDDCFRIMQRQGCQEGTGLAKITRAYNLPCRFILHTVGPICQPGGDDVDKTKQKQLASCYQSCLDLLSRVHWTRTIAFCSISTGVFGFPKKPAARIALQSVQDWCTRHQDRIERIIFNVYSDEDRMIYENLIEHWET